MPLSYAGVVEEHLATRPAVGVFDVSHLGKASCAAGPDGERRSTSSTRCFTNDLDRIGRRPGAVHAVLRRGDRRRRRRPDRLPRRGRRLPRARTPRTPPRCSGCSRTRRPTASRSRTVHRAIATIAVQGPKSAEVLDAVGLPSGMDYMAFERVDWQRTLPVIVCRTGYTGEHGYELMPTADVRRRRCGTRCSRPRQPLGGLPCGLGARDTLRTEMGYPLHGSGPVDRGDAGAGAARLGGRLGQAGVLGPRRARPASRRSARRGCCGGCGPRSAASRARTCRCGRSTTHDLGEVTSGTFSPSLKTGIALALSVPRGRRGRRGEGRRPRQAVGDAGREAAVRPVARCARRRVANAALRPGAADRDDGRRQDDRRPRAVAGARLAVLRQRRAARPRRRQGHPAGAGRGRPRRVASGRVGRA